MNRVQIFILKKLRGIYFRFKKPETNLYNEKKQYGDTEILEGAKANALISKTLIEAKPAMISRFGSVELLALSHYIQYEKGGIKKHIDYIKGGFPGFWEYSDRDPLFYNAGVFPNTEEMFIRFAEEYKKHLPNIDILAAWLNGEEYFFENYFPNARLISLFSYEPYFHSNPWSKHLAGKTVLVIHPFEKSIQSQYKKRSLLFEDKTVLPDFNLVTYKAVQSIAGTNTKYKTWSDALQAMVADISQIKFDVAIIGAGAYGLPLASYIKNMGKIAIHLGGATQVLFGIWGKRYDDPRENDLYRKMKNEHWTRPAGEEIPQNFQNIENGCYW